jgi:hypothetical protein
MLKSDASQEIYKKEHIASQYQSYWDAENSRKLQNSTLSRYIVLILESMKIS